MVHSSDLSLSKYTLPELPLLTSHASRKGNAFQHRTAAAGAHLPKMLQQAKAYYLSVNLQPRLGESVGAVRCTWAVVLLWPRIASMPDDFARLTY